MPTAAGETEDPRGGDPPEGTRAAPFHLHPEDYARMRRGECASEQWRAECERIYSWTRAWLMTCHSYGCERATEIACAAYAGWDSSREDARSRRQRVKIVLGWIGEVHVLVEADAIEYQGHGPCLQPIVRPAPEIAPVVPPTGQQYPPDAILTVAPIPARPEPVVFDEWLRGRVEDLCWQAAGKERRRREPPTPRGNDGPTWDPPDWAGDPDLSAERAEDTAEAQRRRLELAARLNRINLARLVMCLDIYHRARVELSSRAAAQRRVLDYGAAVLEAALTHWRASLAQFLDPWQAQGLSQALSRIGDDEVASFAPPDCDRGSFYDGFRACCPTDGSAQQHRNTYDQTTARLRDRLGNLGASASGGPASGAGVTIPPEPFLLTGLEWVRALCGGSEDEVAAVLSDVRSSGGSAWLEWEAASAEPGWLGLAVRAYAVCSRDLVPVCRAADRALALAWPRQRRRMRPAVYIELEVLTP